MRNRVVLITLTCGALTLPAAWADDKTKAIIGGGVGGAVGAAVGDEIGDRNGAIVGSAIGAAVGTAIATHEDDDHKHRSGAGYADVHVDLEQHGHPHVRHCPPGQAKKNRC